MNKVVQYLEIERLIECPKNIIAPPKREMTLHRGNWRNDMKLQEQGGDNVFSVFMRKNADFEENFSIGLIHLPKGVKGDAVLIRLNGPHGPHLLFDYHDRYHIHIAHSDNMEAGLKEERKAFITNEYASFQEALAYFIKRCRILNANDYFPPYIQMNLENI